MRNIIAISLLLPFSFSSVLWADAAHDQAVAAIQEFGGSVREIAANDERVEVDFHLLGEQTQNEYLAPVAKLSGVYRVHLGGTPITDAGLAHLKGLNAIEYLHLDRTKVTDTGLDVVAGLTTLKYLNLYATAVTDAGLRKLAGLKNLEKLYLWQTKVTEKGVQDLKTKLPKVAVDTGWDVSELVTPDKPPAEPEK